MTLQTYLESLARRFRSGHAKEHAYRGDLEQLIRALAPGIEVTNEPANVTDCGNPDFVLQRGPVPVGYIEAKDIGKDLDSKQYREQFDRYRRALDNLIITDYCRFRFFQEGVPVHDVRIAEIRDGHIAPLPDQFERFQRLIADFVSYSGQTIKSPQKLAELMAAKARLLQNILEKAVRSDETEHADTALKEQFAGFRQVLLHDLTPKEFSDLYAQTLAYGLFAARLHDPSLDSFSRQEAANLIPRTNPFLRWLFQQIAGYDMDERLRPTVDNLADVFRATDVAGLLAGFGRATRREDPVVHFYETFLAAYDPALRKSRGVWYTPEPVVNFIVRAVDDLLKSEFGLAQGLADTSKIRVKVNSQNEDRRSKTGYKQAEIEVHRVQILDPAAGTGTFLAEIVRHLHRTRFAAMPGAWPQYVEKDLVPRLNGFELLMASYAMAHLKLDLLLAETGAQTRDEQRFRIFLTNSLEEHHPDTGTLFASRLSQEANEANAVKRDTPVMVVIGNPPYSGESSNKSDWIMRLMADYKQEPGGGKLQERNAKWLNDDYAKFIRLGQHLVDKNETGILAYINNHSFLDNPTFRGMRWRLLQSFDTIYILDLHGNAKKKETAPDGSADQNVFDIQQGVSINFFVKTGKKKKGELAKVWHLDLYGKREEKYRFLWDKEMRVIEFTELNPESPQYFFIQKNLSLQNDYNKGIAIVELFEQQSMGITSGNDEKYIAFESKTLIHEFGNQKLKALCYRPFDNRYILYDPDILARARHQFMQHFFQKNLALCIIKRTRGNINLTPVITSSIADKCIASTLDNANIFPLYLYPATARDLFSAPARVPNLDAVIVEKIAAGLGLRYAPEAPAVPDASVFGPLDLFDYVYAVLHSPSYREKYREFLKIDFPRVPYPTDADEFRRLVRLGGALRRWHLLEHPDTDKFTTTYPAAGDNVVAKGYPRYEAGKVYINDNQYFTDVPESAWNFYIGGYQPAQKWLKDRRERALSWEDLLHYQRIVAALAATERVMREIG